jgi:hypothetical protein
VQLVAVPPIFLFFIISVRERVNEWTFIEYRLSAISPVNVRVLLRRLRSTATQGQIPVNTAAYSSCALVSRQGMTTNFIFMFLCSSLQITVQTTM